MMSEKNKTGYDKKEVKVSLFYTGEEDTQFIPWNKGEQGVQSFVKLRKNGEAALFYTGEGSMMENETRRTLMKLTNEGWEQEGDVFVNFDGRSENEKEFDDLFHQDVIRVELGRKLLPLVDPGAGAPLLQILRDIRKNIAKDTGYVTASINVKDNLDIPFDNYIIFVKETPVASGEIFLDRFLVMGNREKFSQLKGWSTKDPVYNQPAMWVEPDQKNKAEELECLIMGPLNVLITHIQASIILHLKELLGLQDIHQMLKHLENNYPIIVEDFLKDKNKLRHLRKILQNLVGERVGIRDLVTILETVGDYEDQLEKTEFISEMVRIALARQICWSYIDAEGRIKGLALSRKFEAKIQNAIKETKIGVKLMLNQEEADLIIKDLRKTLEDYKFPRVIFTDPPSRLFFRKLTEASFPDLGILSTAEIVRGIPVEILGEVELPEGVSVKEPEQVKSAGEEEKKSGGLLGLLKG
jgi:flagellar biosynthesis protein FlhA